MQGILVTLCIVRVIITMFLITLNSSYLSWEYNDPEYAVLKVGFHLFEWLFVRLGPIAFIGAIISFF